MCLYLSISTFSYIRIYRIVRKHQARIYAQQQTVQPNQEIGDFYIFMILCYTPVFVTMSISVLRSRKRSRLKHNSGVHELVH